MGMFQRSHTGEVNATTASTQSSVDAADEHQLLPGNTSECRTRPVRQPSGQWRYRQPCTRTFSVSGEWL